MEYQGYVSGMEQLPNISAKQKIFIDNRFKDKKPHLYDAALSNHKK